MAVAPCLAALVLKIPLVLHDSDAVPGVAHSFFRHRARMRLSGFQVESTDTSRRHVGVPVNPIFAAKLSVEKRDQVLAKYNLAPEAEFILVTGGGGGARSLNLGILRVVDELKLKPDTHLMIITGKAYYQEVKEQVAELKLASRVRVLDFAEDMPDLVRASLGVVTRAGATILTEISLAKKAAIIVPNPLLPRAHQLRNARIFQKSDAAWLVSDTGQQVNLRALKQALDELINNSKKRAKYEQNVAQIAMPNAEQKTLAVLEEILIAQVDSVRHSNDKSVSIAKSESKRLAKLRASKRFLKFLLFFVILVGFLLKIFYIGSIQLRPIENSPLITEVELSELQAEINDFLNQQSFLRRHFFLTANQLRDKFLDKGYVKNVSFRRDLLHSQMIASIQPKYILGSFTSPNLETIITTDGYAVRGYEHLLGKEQFSLNIQSFEEVAGQQQLILSPLDISFLNQIKTYLASQGYKLSEARISTQPREIIFRLKGLDFDIIALTTRDPVEQGIALAIALDFFANPSRNEGIGELVESAEGIETNDTVEPILPIEYVDIRLIDRVIYK